jgi:type VI secretion system protein ImpH
MLASWEPRAASPPRLGLTFFGLFGPQGPMPLHLSAHGRERLAQGDTSFRDFADLLQHRVIGLYYRAWAGSRPGLSGEVGGAERFTFYLRALAGVALPGLEGRDALPDGAKVRHAWLLGSRTHHPERLRYLLEAALGVRVAVSELQPAWLDIPEHGQTRLGEQHAGLGTAAVAGSRVLDVQHRFSLRLGPMPLATYLALLPGGAAHRTLTAAVRGLIGDALAWDAVLVLAGAEVPPLRLDGSRALGWTSWLGRSPARGDADDLALEPQLAAA